MGHFLLMVLWTQVSISLTVSEILCPKHHMPIGTMLNRHCACAISRDMYPWAPNISGSRPWPFRVTCRNVILIGYKYKPALSGDLIDCCVFCLALEWVCALCRIVLFTRQSPALDAINTESSKKYNLTHTYRIRENKVAPKVFVFSATVRILTWNFTDLFSEMFYI